MDTPLHQVEWYGRNLTDQSYTFEDTDGHYVTAHPGRIIWIPTGYLTLPSVADAISNGALHVFGLPQKEKI